MKIGKIRALCKAAGEVVVLETGTRRQWIGTQEAVYPIDGMTITKENIGQLLDMPDIMQDLKVRFERIGDITLTDAGVGPGWATMEMGMPFRFAKKMLVPIMDGEEICFVREEFIRAAEQTVGYQIFHKAENAIGQRLIVIDDRMYETGIVSPVPEDTAEMLLEYMRGLTAKRAIGSMREEEDKEPQIDGQIGMDEMIGEEE
ncbi:MAG: hypothetical protein J6K32_12870 [Clostridia bacterium]|nr:hypothetical protein [Clostridia bacterium]